MVKTSSCSQWSWVSFHKSEEFFFLVFWRGKLIFFLSFTQCCIALGSKGGAVVTALASHQCGPGAPLGGAVICGWSLLLGLFLAPRGFSPGTPVFPSPQKPALPNYNLSRNQVDEEPLCWCATCKSLLFLFIYCMWKERRDLIYRRWRKIV